MPPKRKSGSSISADATRPDPAHVFILCAGAGGSWNWSERDGSLPALLSEMYPTSVIIGPISNPKSNKLITGGGGVTLSIAGIFSSLLTKTCSDYPGSRIFFMTQSFGGRVAVHVAAGVFEQRSKDAPTAFPRLPGGCALPSNFAGIIAGSYPLRDENRAPPLTMLAETVNLLLIVGTEDVSFDRALYEATVPNIKAAHDVLWVEGGGHTFSDIKKKSRGGSWEDKIETVRARVKAFVDSTSLGTASAAADANAPLPKKGRQSNGR